MKDADAPYFTELRVLTSRPEEMARFWAALLDATAQPLNGRMTAIGSARGRVAIERSQIALDYHPEGCGVIAITLAADDGSAVLRAVTRLAAIGSDPYRATHERGVTALWFQDPNGADIALLLPQYEAIDDAPSQLFPYELDPAAVIDILRTNATHVSSCTTEPEGRST